LFKVGIVVKWPLFCVDEFQEALDQGFSRVTPAKAKTKNKKFKGQTSKTKACLASPKLNGHVIGVVGTVVVSDLALCARMPETLAPDLNLPRPSQ
jgi:hypothetical protein